MDIHSVITIAANNNKRVPNGAAWGGRRVDFHQCNRAPGAISPGFILSGSR